jgi:integrase
MNRRPNTLRFHKECLAPLDKHFDGKRLGEVTESQVENYKQGRVKNGRGMVAANRQLASLSALYNWCRDQKPPLYEGSNPVEGVERYEESEGRIRFLERDEEAKFLDAAGEPLRTIALCGTDAALRIKAEALTLRWSALDFRRGVLTVESAYAKNRNTRAIPMTERLKEALVQHRFRSGKQEAEAHVFVSGSKKPFRSIRNIFRSACAAAGLGEDVRRIPCDTPSGAGSR